MNPTITPDSLSLGMYIGIPVVAFFALICLITTLIGVFGDDAGEFFWSGLVGWVILVGVTVVAYWPFDMEFHRFYKVEGTVTDIGKRQIAQDGGGMSERYVFNFNGQLFGVDDTRAAVVKPGDRVTIKCKRDYVWNSESGWVCRWVAYQPKPTAS